MKIIERTNNKGQSVLLYSNCENDIPGIKPDNEFREDGYRIVEFGEGYRIYQGKDGSMFVLNTCSLGRVDFL